ncbi:MAG: hypothetical protein ISS72_04135, partial [Candidatus Brocadiae bacterium]|nr:hypothetical protein [Candidatus Brocadiia bacterium]
MSVSRHPRSRIAALAALATLALLPATARGLTARALVPASFRHKMDGMGFRWDISHNGTMSDGAHNSFNQLGYLHVNGN